MKRGKGKVGRRRGKYQPKITSSTLNTWKTKNDPFYISSTIFKIPKPNAQKFQTEVCALFYFIQCVRLLMQSVLG